MPATTIPGRNIATVPGQPATPPTPGIAVTFGLRGMEATFTRNVGEIGRIGPVCANATVPSSGTIPSSCARTPAPSARGPFPGTSFRPWLIIYLAIGDTAIFEMIPLGGQHAGGECV